MNERERKPATAAGAGLHIPADDPRWSLADWPSSPAEVERGLSIAPWGEQGRLQHDSEGKPIVTVARCGTCGREWNDALITSITPTPAGRCPFEYEHG